MTLRFEFIATALLLAGCQTEATVMDSKQPTAVSTALARGRFDLNCPAATGSVLSRQYIQAPGGAVVMGVTRTEYTVGVQGCGQRGTYLVVCSEGTTGCIAGDRQQ